MSADTREERLERRIADLYVTAVFRCDMILAEPRYAGQLNVPDMFTRLLLSLVATGIAPESFYELDAAGNRQRAHYDGLPVDFIAEAISILGAHQAYGFETYHVMNPYDDGIGLDEFVDWLVEAGYPIDRVADYGEWLQRFETSMRALPDKQRQASLLPLLHSYAQPAKPLRGSFATTEPIPRRGARGESRPGQRHPACLGGDHRQVHHRSATARSVTSAARPTLSSTIAHQR